MRVCGRMEQSAIPSTRCSTLPRLRAFATVGLVGALIGCGGPVEVDRTEADPPASEELDPVVIRTAELRDATQGHAYSHTLLAEGGDGAFTWRVNDGTLPEGISLDEATGELSGTAVEWGSWTFTVEAMSSTAEPGQKLLDLVVHPELIILSDSLPPGEVGMSYVFRLRSSGGSGVPRWSLDGSLPEGLELDAQGVGLLTGVPEVAGRFELPFVLEQGELRLEHRLELEIASRGTPQDRWTGIDPWRARGRDGSHRGYVPVTLDPSHFSVRWRAHLGARADDPRGEIVSTDHAALLADGSGYLVALDLNSGEQLWEQRRLPGWGWPGTDDGRAYVTTAEGSRSELLRLDARSGGIEFAVPFENQFMYHLSPIIQDAMVLTGSGRFGGLGAYDQADGRLIWFQDSERGDLDLEVRLAPAVDGAAVYVPYGKALRSYELGTGELVVDVPGACECAYLPIVAAADRILARGEDQGSIIAVDPIAESVAWSHPAWGPVVSDGNLVYLATEMGIEVLDVRDGSVTDGWVPPYDEFDVSGMVLTDNLLFFRLDGSVHAVDTSTWEEVWRYPEGGLISISEGFLLLNGEDQVVTGIGLGADGS